MQQQVFKLQALSVSITISMFNSCVPIFTGVANGTLTFSLLAYYMLKCSLKNAGTTSEYLDNQFR